MRRSRISKQPKPPRKRSKLRSGTDPTSSFASRMAANYPLAHPDEVPILRDIEKRTGLVFNRLQNIADDEEARRAVLPIAEEWIPLTTQQMRFVLYFLFETRDA